MYGAVITQQPKLPKLPASLNTYTLWGIVLGLGVLGFAFLRSGESYEKDLELVSAETAKVKRQAKKWTDELGRLEKREKALETILEDR